MKIGPTDRMSLDPAVEYIEPDVCGIYFRTILLHKRGDKVDQHVHDHDHATYIGNGMVVAWADGVCLGEYNAGQALEIKAGMYHEFQALVDNTRLSCVHSIASAESIKAQGL